MSGPTRRRVTWAATATLGASSLVAVCGMTPALAATPTAAVPAAAPAVAAPAAAPAAVAVDGEYTQRFLELYEDIHDPANGYFSPQGIPYHSVETFIVEAPDYGHETTSEAYSFWIWLESAYGQATGDWGPLNDAWATMEKYMIPTSADQPTNSFYKASSPATYAGESNHPSNYPSVLSSGVSVGQDPIAAELKSAYGTDDIYGMHWLADVDNVYGFGASPGAGCTNGPGAGTSYINTFQRGPQESVYETIPQPSCDEFEFGGPNGYLDLFTKDSSYAKQWKYTNAPDADARAIDAMYWAKTWAAEQGKSADIAGTVSKASKMGDYLRYSMFDKYFKKIGCTSTSCAAGTGKDSAHYLMSWYYAWGGATDTNAGWAWRIGSSHNHFGYQNPMAAWALSTDSALKPKGATAVSDWSTSLDRQLEFYQWLQSADGGIAGGATNSWDGVYGAPPAGTSTFYGMGYTEAPVYNDPPSNNWFGMQVWSMERIAQLYYASGNPKAKALLDKWVPWAMANTDFTTGADWAVPSNLKWTGQPDTWNATSPGSNANLRVSVVSKGQDVGVAGGLARTLMYYAAKSGDTTAQANAKTLLDAIWTNNRDAIGVSSTEVREDFKRLDDVMTSTSGDGIYVPNGWTGTMPNGDVIKPGVSFLDIRSWYKNDPAWPKVKAYLDGGAAPSFNYHRFWAQTAIATALADYDRLFNGTTPPVDTTAPSVPTGLTSTAKTSTSVTLGWTASTDDVAVTGYDVYRGATKVGSSATTSYTDTGLTASTAYSYTVRAKDAAGNVSAASAALAVTTSAGTGTGTCKVVYTTNDWSTGFTGSVKVTNTGSALSSWTLGFSFGAGQTVQQGWSAVWSQTGAVVTATNAPWNGNLGAGQSVDIGFNGSHTGTNPKPTAFTLNGSPCSLG
jgi:hypothetical protein